MIRAIGRFNLTVVLLLVGCGADIPSTTTNQKSFLKASQLLVNGEPTDFKSGPKHEIFIRSTHPRLMFNAADIDAIRIKLKSPEYRKELAYLEGKKAKTRYGGASIQAFRWQIFGDKKARELAKRQLLSGKIDRWGHPFSKVQWMFAWATTYDWLSDSLTQEERKQAWESVKSKMGKNMSSYLDQSYAPHFDMNHNDSWGRRLSPYEAAVAIAIHGDGVDDALAEHILSKCVEGHESFLSPYVMLDWLNLMALDSGGSQASHDSDNVSGYAGMYAYSCLLYHGYWTSGAGDNLWDRSNFYRFFPLWNTYDNDSPLRNNGLAIMEVVAGRYQKSGPDMSALAAWYLKEFGFGEINNNFLLPKLIWGDRRIIPRSPEALGLPLAKHLRGADCFVSRSSWSKNATVVNVATRTLDHLRYDPAPGVISIYQDGKPILVDTRKGKWRRKPVTASGVQLGRGVGSMYWKPPHQFYKRIRRPTSTLQVVSNSAYYPNCLKESESNGLYHSVTVKYDHLSLDKGTNSAFRTVIHLYQSPEFVVVVDQWEVGNKTDTLINWRLVSEPQIAGNTFTWDGAAATVLNAATDSTLQWVGGIGHELERLDGSWGGDKKAGYKPGYGKSKGRLNRMGLGNVYLAGKGSNQCVTIIEIGASEPPEVVQHKNRISFSQYQLVIRENTSFELTQSNTTTAP